MAEYYAGESPEVEPATTIVGSYDWKVPCRRKDLRSPEFSVGPEGALHLSLHLFHVTVDQESAYSISVAVKRIQTAVVKATMKHSIRIMNSRGDEMRSWTQQLNGTVICEGSVWPMGVVLNQWIEDSHFTIHYEVDVQNVVSRAPAIRENFRILFEEQHDYDLTFFVDSQIFTAHEFLLSVRCPEFLTSIEHQLQENGGQVKIPDIDAPTFKEFLRFVYTQEVQNLEQHAAKLLKVAWTYDLPKLKVMCETELFKNINVANAAEIFSAACDGQSKTLKQYAADFIYDNEAAVECTDGYDRMTHPQHFLLEELLRTSHAKKRYRRRLFVD